MTQCSLSAPWGLPQTPGFSQAWLGKSYLPKLLFLVQFLRKVDRNMALWGHNLGRNNFVDGKSSRAMRSVDRVAYIVSHI